MYKHVILGLVLLGSFCIACRKAVNDQASTVNDISNTKGSCTLFFPNTDLKFTGAYLTKENDAYTIVFLEYDAGRQVKTQLRLSDIQLAFGKQQLSRTVTDETEIQQGAHTCLHLNETVDGSEVCHVNEVAWPDNMLEIYEIDAQTGWVRGRFDCSYIRESYSDAAPTTIDIRGALFEFRL